MKNRLFYLLLILTMFSCSEDYKYDQLDFNIFGGKSRTNAYEHFGNFPLQIVSLEQISGNDSMGVVQTAVRLKSPYYVVATSDGKIVRINNTSSDKKFLIDSSFIAASGIVADKKSNIYFISSNDILYALDFDLNLKWKQEVPVPKSRMLTFSDLLAVDDGIIVAASTGNIFKYNFQGKIIWEYNSSLSANKTFCSDEKGNIYLPLTNNEFGKSDTIISLSKNGEINWQVGFPYTRLISSTVYRNGKIYATGGVQKDSERSGVTICIDDKGKQLWKSEHTLPGRNISVDYFGGVYITSISSGIGEIKTGIYGFDLRGKEMWNIYFGIAPASPLLIAEKYIAFTGYTGDGAAMIFLRKSDGLLIRNHSLSNFPPLYLQPTVFDDAAIKLFGSTKLVNVKFSETILEKILP